MECGRWNGEHEYMRHLEKQQPLSWQSEATALHIDLSSVLLAAWLPACPGAEQIYANGKHAKRFLDGAPFMCLYWSRLEGEVRGPQ